MGIHRHIELSLDIARPQSTVWEALTDWPRQSAWMTATTVRRVAGEHGVLKQGVGERLEAFSGAALGPVRLGVLDTMEVTRWEPPHRCDVVHTGRVVRGTGTFIVTAAGPESATLTWIEDLDLPLGPLGAAGYAALRWFVVGQIRASLERFAASLAAS